MSDLPLNEVFKAWSDIVEHLNSIRQELETQSEQIRLIIQDLLEARKDKKEVVLLGAGRCAEILNMFATRLVQPVRYKETETRLFDKKLVKLVSEKAFVSVIKPNALVICLSGTGKTGLTVTFAEVYVDMGANLILITSNRKGKLVKKARVTIYLPGISDKDIEKHEYEYGTEQPIYIENTHPGPTIFECSALILLESICFAIIRNIEE